MRLRIILIYMIYQPWYIGAIEWRKPMIALLKTLTYGIMHIVVATTLAYVISGSWAIAVSIGLLEPLVQTVFFYGHERVWDKFKLRLSNQGGTGLTQV